ncbi:MAG TPA: hypothetical protein VMM60_09335 [Ilumatobacter sp.]|nr:hypothetical protein [Ilumatobacter sp.]
MATALLSGAGLMVLLPAMMKDQIAGVVGTLLTVDPSLPHVLLAVVAGIVLALPLVVFFMLLGDLTRFYFHAHHVETAHGMVFVPRFTLTGLRISNDELSSGAADELRLARTAPSAVELVVPPNTSGKRRIDRRLAAYGLDGSTGEVDDQARADGLFELVASQSRSLADEVAKVEYGMTRHLVRLQVIVIRYVKSLLLFLVTALTVFAAAAVVVRDDRVGLGGQLWLAVIFAAWAPVAALAVSSPVRWVDGMLRAEGATARSVAADSEFARFERVVTSVGAVVLAISAVVLVLCLFDGADTDQATAGVTAIVTAAVTFAWAATRSLVTPTLSGRGG